MQTESVQENSPPSILPQLFSSLHYELSIEPNLTDNIFLGVCSWHFSTLADSDHILFHQKYLTFTSVTIDGDELVGTITSLGSQVYQINFHFKAE